MEVDRTLLWSSFSKDGGGILLVLTSTVMMGMADLITKLLVTSMPAAEIMWFRYVLAAVASGGFLMIRRRRLHGIVIDHRLQLIRGVATMAAGTLFAIGLIYLPIGDATGLNFIAPVLVTALSVLLLHERVGWRRWLAAALGFIGVLLIAAPGNASFQLASLLPLTAAFFWAIALVSTRKMGSTQYAPVTLCYSSIIGFTLTSLSFFYDVKCPDLTEALIAVLAGAVAAFGNILLIAGYQRAPASTLAPISYFQVPLATFFGYFSFGAFPNAIALSGIALILVSGLYTTVREQKI